MPKCTARSPATTRASSPTSIITGCRAGPPLLRRQCQLRRSRRRRPSGASKAMIRQLDERTLVSGQVAPHEVAELAGQGVTMLVNNRPDGEEPGQPLASEIEDAAAAAGIGYRFVPIMRGIGPADVESMQEAMREAEGGKLLAFC